MFVVVIWVGFFSFGSQNGLSGVAPKFGIHCGTNRSDVLPLSLCCRVDMTAGSDLVFDNLSHNHIKPRAEYQLFKDVLLVHNDLSLDERLLFARGETVGGEGLFVDCIHQLKQ